jgi:capsular exopolysaccharide synthesis family protein
MPRLTDALERARLVPPADHPVAAPSVKSSDEVLQTWSLDVPDGRATPSPAGATTSEPIATCRIPEHLMGKMVLGDQADTGLVEQMRRVAAVLHHAQAQRGVRSVMVGSAVAAEGKTLTATNLALTLSHSFDRRVLLLDADLRRPSVHEMFGLPNDRGLVDNLRSPHGGRLPVHAVSRNLWVLTAGKPTSDPMSILVSDMMKQLLADAMEQFDWVIVDTPPVAMIPDANLLAAMIDKALIVINACTTPYPLVKRAAAAIGADRILGVILNRDERGVLGHEYGHYYGDYGRTPRTVAAPKRRFGRRSGS